MMQEENSRLSYLEFLYEQARFIQKRWWGLQALVLLLLWFLLKDSDNAGDMGRMMGILATVFTILIIPEIWKTEDIRRWKLRERHFIPCGRYARREFCCLRLLIWSW